MARKADDQPLIFGTSLELGFLDLPRQYFVTKSSQPSDSCLKVWLNGWLETEDAQTLGYEKVETFGDRSRYEMHLMINIQDRGNISTLYVDIQMHR